MTAPTAIARNPEPSLFGRIVRFLKRTNAETALKTQIQHERNQLIKLTDSELRDIGLTRADAIREGRRNFDDVPAHRLKGIPH